MSDAHLPTPSGPAAVIRHELEALRDQWCWFLALGIGMIVLGTLGMGMACLLTKVTVVFFGVLMLIAGIAQIVGAFWVGRWSGFMVTMLVGVLYVIAGFMVVDNPVGGALSLTLLIAAMLMVGGIFRIVSAMVLRHAHWGWPLLNGVVSLMLGIMIYKQWPESAFWVIGLYVSIEMIFNGWTWVMLGLGLKSLPKA